MAAPKRLSDHLRAQQPLKGRSRGRGRSDGIRQAGLESGDSRRIAGDGEDRV
jgi:hypothetical protein